MSKGVHFGLSDYLAIRFPHPNVYAPIASDFPYTSASFYVWYMDKNRPFPPGELFDSICESDYLRRKTEDFPDPLYDSAIETPEWKGAETKYEDFGGDIRSRLRLVPALSSLAGSEPQREAEEEVSEDTDK